jgi:hypothetical protein
LPLTKLVPILHSISDRDFGLPWDGAYSRGTMYTDGVHVSPLGA